MPKSLEQAQIGRYREENFLSPLFAMSGAQASRFRRQLEAYESTQGGAPLEPWQYRKLHVREAWAAELIRIPSVLDAVEDLIGPDILVFNSTFFIKEPRTNQHTAWHQDATYFGLTPHEHVTAWIAISSASERAGCLQFIVGSSALGQCHHAAQTVPGSVNHGGQAIVGSLDTTTVQSAPLDPGQFSFHHTLVVHSSAPNQTIDRRIGIGISYIPTRVRHTGSYRMGATLVRGSDEFGHFELESDPRAHDAVTNARNHEAAYRRYREGYDEQIAEHKARFASL